MGKKKIDNWKEKKKLEKKCGKIISGRERFEEEIDIYVNQNEVCDVKENIYNKENLNSIDDKGVEYLKNEQKQLGYTEKLMDEQANIEKKEEKQKKKSVSNNLYSMSNKILEKVTLILHDGNLYYYTGKSYKIIKNSEELLGVIRFYVSDDAFGSTSIRQFADLLVFLKSDRRLIPKKYEKKIWESQYYIAFNNGILDIRTLQLHNHSEKYLVFYELDLEWREGSKPKHFMKFLKQISRQDESIKNRVMEALGYLLSNVNEGKYFFVMGTAYNSGKSTLANMLQNFIGEMYIAHLSPYQMGNRFALGDIHGKTLNLSMDLPKGKFMPIVISIIKQITGKDAITTERKFENMRDLHSNMRFLFASNYPVTVSKEDGDNAFWNRMVIIPFLYSLEKEDIDIDFLRKLEKEKEDIVFLCLTAFNKVLNQGCIFSECEVADNMKKDWMGLEDDLAYTVQNFFEECIEITDNQQKSIYATELYNRYQNYCKINGWDYMKYNNFIEWCNEHIPECKKKRIHHTGQNPRAGFTNMNFL